MLLAASCALNGELRAFYVIEDPVVETGVTESPNIVLIMTDDLGWGDTGYYGHPILQTPSLDAMAESGVRFDRFYAAAPVCSPTRGSMLTGRHPYRYGIRGANTGHVRQGEFTLAEILGEAGYATGHFGKWHLGTLTNDLVESNRGGRSPENYAPPWEHGFVTCFATEAKVPTWWHEGVYDSYNTHYWTGPDEMVPSETVLGDDSKLIVDAADSFIRESVSSGQSFFAVVWFHAPHKPYVAGPRYLEMYAEHDRPDDGERRFKESPADYYGCVTALDEQIGVLRKTLSDLEVSDNTIVWFCSDNGPENRTPGRALADLDGPEGDAPIQLRERKRSLYEGGIRVPGLLVWPERIPQPRIVSAPCVTSDILPTVLAAAGIEMTDDRPLDGRNIWPVIDGEQELRNSPIGFQSGSQQAVIDDRFKLVRKKTDNPWQLFDINDDPGESTDIAADHPDVVQQMEALFMDFRDSCRQSNSGADYKESRR
ncbi:MAG: sulfatase-like hydrolase/transferase [Planctomycetota bacterium]